MSLEEEYPKTYRNFAARLRAILEVAPGLSEREREDLATAMNEMADKARDLDDIVQRLLNEPHTPEEIGQLLIAFELTTEQLRGHSDTVDGKLYELGDRLSDEQASSTVRGGAETAQRVGTTVRRKVLKSEAPRGRGGIIARP